MDPDIEFLSEIGATERATFSTLFGVSADKILQTPLDKFKIKVDAYARQVMDEGYVSNNDIAIMVEKSAELEYIMYKNPYAYVLGYMANRGGLLKNSFQEVVKKFLPQEGVTEPDVLRYARLWDNSLG